MRSNVVAYAVGRIFFICLFPMINNKLTRLLLLLLPLLLAACGSSDDEGGGNGSNNVNSNFKEANIYTHRLEFPRLKNSGTYLIVHTLGSGEVNYSVEWDIDKRSQRWSCYEIYSSLRESHTSRYTSDTNQYPQDPLLPEEYRWSNDPFWGSGYNHGHICPSADRLSTREANIQTFYLTNMMPQVTDFNAGVWETMESWVRNQIKVGSKDTLYVCKGGTIDRADQVLSTKVHGMIIPKYYFMALLMKNSSGYKAMAFWAEHKSNKDTNLARYVVNVRELERLTGIDFFCNLPDDIENHVESLNTDNVKRAWGLGN